MVVVSGAVVKENAMPVKAGLKTVCKIQEASIRDPPCP
jgi:hypothetical protein